MLALRFQTCPTSIQTGISVLFRLLNMSKDSTPYHIFPKWKQNLKADRTSFQGYPINVTLSLIYSHDKMSQHTQTPLQQ